MEPDGVPVGIEETIEAIAQSHPFLLADDAATTAEKDPFKTASSSSGRVMNGKK